MHVYSYIYLRLCTPFPLYRDDPDVYENMGTDPKKGEAGVYEEIEKFSKPPLHASVPTPYERPRTSLPRIEATQQQLPSLPTQSHYQRPRANTDTLVNTVIMASHYDVYEIPRDVGVDVGATTTTTTESTVPLPGQYDHIRPRTESNKVANCPMYAPVDIKKL